MKIFFTYNLNRMRFSRPTHFSKMIQAVALRTSFAICWAYGVQIKIGPFSLWSSLVLDADHCGWLLVTCLSLLLLTLNTSADDLFDFSNASAKRNASLIRQNQVIFTGLGCFPDEFKLNLRECAVPKSSPARRIPLKILDKLKSKLLLLYG